jgi:hypothetical protein
MPTGISTRPETSEEWEFTVRDLHDLAAMGDAAGPDTYCEYPANLIRIVQRFLLGVDLRLDGSLVLSPTVTDEFWKRGFGQTLAWRERTLRYTMKLRRIEGEYAGSAPQLLGVCLSIGTESIETRATIDGKPVLTRREGKLVFITLPPVQGTAPHRFEILQ